MSDILEYKCPNCGGRLEFDSGTQKMNCPFCDSEIDIEALKKFDEKLNTEPKEDTSTWNTSDEWTEAENDGMCVYTCDTCGGEVIAEQTTAATHCPYCDNPIIFTSKLSGSLKPDYVIPFKLSKEDAKKGLAEHLKKKPLLPKVFKTENHLDEVKAVYVPFWLYDAKVDADVTFKATSVHSWSDSDYYYTETKFYEVIRDGSLEFVRVPADGSSKMPDDLMESVEPFNFDEAVDFQTAYLSGFLADKYDVSSDENLDRVKERMKNTTIEMLENTIGGYDTTEVVGESCSYQNASVKYALYPVYILNTTWKGEKYTFAMNGQTGKFVGNLPVSKGKYTALLLGLTAGFSGIATLLASLFLG